MLDAIVYNIPPWWLAGPVALMIMIGIATGFSLWLLGIPLALVLGLIAGGLEIIPPVDWLSDIPAILIALLVIPWHALFVIGLFLAIHILEGYVLGPLVLRRAVALPPAITVVAQVLFGAGSLLAWMVSHTPRTAPPPSEIPDADHQNDQIEHRGAAEHDVIPGRILDRMRPQHMVDPLVNGHAAADRKQEDRDHPSSEVQLQPVAERMLVVGGSPAERPSDPQQHAVAGVDQRMNPLGKHRRAAGDRRGHELDGRHRQPPPAMSARTSRVEDGAAITLVHAWRGPVGSGAGGRRPRRGLASRPSLPLPALSSVAGSAFSLGTSGLPDWLA